MSKFFKGFGWGAGLVAIAGVVGAGVLAVKKIKQSDKQVNDLIKNAFNHGKKSHCDVCDNDVCTCSEATEDPVIEISVTDECISDDVVSDSLSAESTITKTERHSKRKKNRK